LPSYHDNLVKQEVPVETKARLKKADKHWNQVLPTN